MTTSVCHENVQAAKYLDLLVILVCFCFMFLFFVYLCVFADKENERLISEQDN